MADWRDEEADVNDTPQWRIVNTDNHGSDYPNERFMGEPFTDENAAQSDADLLNGPYPESNRRYYKVVRMPYELQPGFEA